MTKCNKCKKDRGNWNDMTERTWRSWFEGDYLVVQPVCQWCGAPYGDPQKLRARN